MTKTSDVRRLLSENGGVLRRSDHPELATSIAWLLRSATGGLVAPHPGIVMVKELERDFDTRVRAAALWRPDGVFTGDAAVRLGFDAERPVPALDLLVARRPVAAGQLRIHQSRLPLDHFVGSGLVRWTSAAWTAVWLAEWDEGCTIDEVLRLGQASIQEINDAWEAMPRLMRSETRRFVVRHSSHNPWSPAERRFQMMLRRHDITGWVGNRSIHVGGMTFTPDVVFDECRLVVEVQSVAHHTDPATFYRDNEKVVALTSCGWTWLPVTVPMMAKEVPLIEALKATIRRCRLELGLLA